jgi:hypothetical protein
MTNDKLLKSKKRSSFKQLQKFLNDMLYDIFVKMGGAFVLDPYITLYKGIVSLMNGKMVSALAGLGVLMFNATFNNISVILWQALLLVEGTGVPRENH